MIITSLWMMTIMRTEIRQSHRLLTMNTMTMMSSVFARQNDLFENFFWP